VSLAWNQFDIIRGSGGNLGQILAKMRGLETETDSSGHYRVCGVPGDSTVITAWSELSEDKPGPLVRFVSLPDSIIRQDLLWVSGEMGVVAPRTAAAPDVVVRGIVVDSATRSPME